MRILYSHRVQSRDGQSVHIDELVAAFRSLGHEVMVVGPSFYAEAKFGGESGAVARLRRLLPGAAQELAELAYNILAYRRLARARAAFRPDIIYERYNLFHLAGAWLARRQGIPLFLEVNAPLAEERALHGGLRLRFFARWAERHAWRTANRVLAVTRVLADRIEAAGVDPARILVVPNGVVLSRFPWPAHQNAADPVSLGFVGFVRPWHGLDAVIRAMAGQSGVELTIAGDGPVRADLERLASDLGLRQRVHFLGVVPHADVPRIVAGFDIALQPRVVEYASPLKIFDYMAAGRAIVAPDQPNIREILADGETALLFSPSTEGALWAAIAQLIRDPSLRERLGQAARAALESHDYTWMGNARRIVGWARAAMNTN